MCSAHPQLAAGRPHHRPMVRKVHRDRVKEEPATALSGLRRVFQLSLQTLAVIPNEGRNPGVLPMGESPAGSIFRFLAPCQWRRQNVPMWLSTFKENVRLTVQRKCHLSSPRSYQMPLRVQLRATAASADFRHRCIALRCLCGDPAPLPSCEWTCPGA